MSDASLAKMRAWRPSIWVLIAVVVSSVGIALRERCRPDLWGAAVNTFAHGCYSDISSLYSARGFVNGVVPYATAYNGTYFEYPVLTGAAVRVVQILVMGVDDLSQRIAAFMRGTSLLLIVAAAITTYAVARLAGPGSLAPAAIALSPLLLLNLAVNWDMFAVACIVLALWMRQRDRATEAAVFAALGTAFKLWPAFALAAFVLDAAHRRDARTAIRIVGAATGTWLLVNVPVYLAYPDGWAAFYTFSATRGTDWGSLWTALSLLTHWQVSVSTMNLVGILAMALGALGIGWLGWRHAASATLVTLSLVTLFILTGKAGAVQYSLWLLPLVALTVREPRVQISWQAVQVAFFLGANALMLYLMSNGVRGLPSERFAYVVLLWHAANVGAALWAWREHLRAMAVRTTPQ